MSTRRLRVFKRWMTSHGVDYNTNALTFTDTAHEGISVIATRDLNEGEVVATIPKSACLTTKTTGASKLIEESGLGDSLGLSVAVMYERSLRHHSRWAGYLQLLPESECLPLVWTLDEVDHLLRGTELHKTLREDKELMYEDWKENVLPFVDLLPGDADKSFFGVEQYFAAKSLVASRSFEIDGFHGFGMVPLADLLNHKTGAEDVHFTTVSSHSDSEDAEDGYNNDSCENNADVERLSSEVEPSLNAGDDSMMLEMIMVKDVKAGAEVFNTYGCVGNAGLLHRYGFTEPDNPYDIVNIDMELVLQWGSSMFSRRYSRARISLWRKLGYCACVSQSSEYFEISSDGRPQIELLILLYIMLLPEDANHKLDLAVSSANNCNGWISIIVSEKCNSTSEKGLEVADHLLLTEGVCSAILSLADRRESLYGTNSLKDVTEALEKCCRTERKLYHSLMLRVSERRILKKLRTYATIGAQSSKANKRASKRKRMKRTCDN